MKNKKSIQASLSISISLVFMLACSLLAPSNNGTNSPADESSPDNPILPTGLPEINIPFSSESPNLEFIPNNIQVSAPESGWINYYLELALKNNNAFSLQLYYLQLSTFALETGLHTVVINPVSSYVETKEGENYPVEFARLGSKIIPPSLLIKGFPEPIAVTFRVPEKLTPTNLVLSPGIVLVSPEEIENYTNGNSLLSFTETPVEIFGKETTSLLPNETQDYSQQPHQVNITEQVVADFPGSISAKLLFGWGDNDLTLELSIPLTNNDITSDQEFDINAFATDQYGYQYSNNFCPDGYFDKLGPGQTNTLKMCFTLPPDSARLPRDLFLTYYWNKQEESYKIKIDNIVSCDPSTVEAFFEVENRLVT